MSGSGISVSLEMNIHAWLAERLCCFRSHNLMQICRLVSARETQTRMHLLRQTKASKRLGYSHASHLTHHGDTQHTFCVSCCVQSRCHSFVCRSQASLSCFQCWCRLTPAHSWTVHLAEQVREGFIQLSYQVSSHLYASTSSSCECCFVLCDLLCEHRQLKTVMQQC